MAGETKGPWAIGESAEDMRAWVCVRDADGWSRAYCADASVAAHIVACVNDNATLKSVIAGGDEAIRRMAHDMVELQNKVIDLEEAYTKAGMRVADLEDAVLTERGLVTLERSRADALAAENKRLTKLLVYAERDALEAQATLNELKGGSYAVYANNEMRSQINGLESDIVHLHDTVTEVRAENERLRGALGALIVAGERLSMLLASNAPGVWAFESTPAAWAMLVGDARAALAGKGE